MEEIVVQYFDNPVLYKFILEEERQVEVSRLSVSVVRFGGWLPNISRVGGKMMKVKIKKFWYGVSWGKDSYVPNVQKEGKKKL